MIPDVPYAVRERIKREKYLTQVILHETNLKLVTKRLKPAKEEAVEEKKANLAMDELEPDFWRQRSDAESWYPAASQFVCPRL